MSDDSANMSGVDSARNAPDAQGQAALLLVESLLHTLVERGVLSNADAVATVRTAADVKIEVALAAHEARDVLLQSLRRLSAVEATFRADER